MSFFFTNWTDINRLPEASSQLHVGYYNDIIYLIGGSTAASQNRQNLVIQYNITSNTYLPTLSVMNSPDGTSESAQLNNVIYYVSAGYLYYFNMTIQSEGTRIFLPIIAVDQCVTSNLNDYLFLIGGSAQDFFYGYNINNSEWISLSPIMNTPRFNHGCQVNQYGTDIYIFGGFGLSQFLDTIETINISDFGNINNAIWNELNDRLSQKRMYVRSFTIQDYIYVIGGYGSSFYGTIDAINTVNNSLFQVDNLNYNAASVAGIFVRNSVYVFGGMINTGNWTQLNSASKNTILLSVIHIFIPPMI